jgi:hypothetical protein
MDPLDQRKAAADHLDRATIDAGDPAALDSLMERLCHTTGQVSREQQQLPALQQLERVLQRMNIAADLLRKTLCQQSAPALLHRLAHHTPPQPTRRPVHDRSRSRPRPRPLPDDRER